MPTPFVPGGPKRYAHQVRGLRKMIATGGVAALLFDPGLGKTATTLDYASVLALKSNKDEVRVLVVCPLAAVDTWVSQALLYVTPGVSVWAEALGGSIQQRAEALAARGESPFKTMKKPRGKSKNVDPRAMHYEKSISVMTRPQSALEYGPSVLPGPRIVLEVVNLDTMSSRAQIGSKTMADRVVEAVRRYRPDLVVVDESHKIKSASANASRVLDRIGASVPRRVILTGTVMPHSPLDIFGQWRFLQPYAFGEKKPDGTTAKATFGGFKMRYAKLGGWMGKEVVGFDNLEEMRDIMSKNSIVARKEESLDLPPWSDVEVPVRLSVAELKAYAEMKSSLQTRLASGELASETSRLTQSMRLRQITAGFLKDDTGVINDLGLSKVKTIASVVNDNLAGESRIVIFANFTHEIELITGLLRSTKNEVMQITGATSAEERMKMRLDFGSKDPRRIVMVAQIRTMSLAVNELVTASHAIFASFSQQRDDYVQARDRLNRIGQTRPVTFWLMVAPDTVDGVILETHRKTGNLESAMLAHIRSGGPG